MTSVHCTIETDPESGKYVGWVVGFRHFAVTGATPDEVEAMLRSEVLTMHDSGSLVLDCQFVRMVSISLPPHPSESCTEVAIGAVADVCSLLPLPRQAVDLSPAQMAGAQSDIDVPAKRC